MWKDLIMENNRLDLTTGKPIQRILQFSTPLIFGTLFQQLYSFVDSIIVGHFISANALGSVGATYSLNFLIIGFMQSFCVGLGIPISQSVGANHHHDVQRFFWNGLYLSIAISILLLCFNDLLHRTTTNCDTHTAAITAWCRHFHSSPIHFHLDNRPIQLFRKRSSLTRWFQDPLLHISPCQFIKYRYWYCFNWRIPLGSNWGRGRHNHCPSSQCLNEYYLVSKGLNNHWFSASSVKIFSSSYLSACLYCLPNGHRVFHLCNWCHYYAICY